MVDLLDSVGAWLCVDATISTSSPGDASPSLGPVQTKYSGSARILCASLFDISLSLLCPVEVLHSGTCLSCAALPRLYMSCSSPSLEISHCGML